VVTPVPGSKGQLNKAWTLLTLPVSLLSSASLCPENSYNGGDHMVLFQEFPWELPGIQSYQIFNIQSTVTDEKMVEVIQGRLGLSLLGPPQIKRPS